MKVISAERFIKYYYYKKYVLIQKVLHLGLDFLL